MLYNQDLAHLLVIRETTTKTTREIKAANISTGAPNSETPPTIPHKA
ncbi:MAG: hypothetical protein PWQ70_2835, partial [Clostridiales bacterium]|nr:hypothetical protein [Clostridiales bacterium]